MDLSSGHQVFLRWEKRVLSVLLCVLPIPPFFFFSFFSFP